MEVEVPPLKTYKALSAFTPSSSSSTSFMPSFSSQSSNVPDELTISQGDIVHVFLRFDSYISME
jgi:hypothetical protein